MPEPISNVTQPITERLFGSYPITPAGYDEVFTPAGVLRPAWQSVVRAMERFGSEELRRRWMQGREDIRETGISFNFFEQAVAVSRPWDLDLLPHLFTSQEWEQLATGLRQRARLLNLLLNDLYGEQRSLQQRLVPAEWLYRNPSFRRVFSRQLPPGSSLLSFYAVDLARAPDGQWWVVADRTDSPMGLGYALENRIVSSRMLPAVIRETNVERLAPFFRQMQQTLLGLAPRISENPRIVLLSHGPTSPNYFEDAYLARYLGYTLVEPGDLAVRDDHVFMKTLAGLLPVDVIHRRLADAYSDPLELRSDATLGVPGLLQAVRLGNVTVANSLGSSLAESPSLIPFLPALSRGMLGEELLLPSIATWWCGQPAIRDQVVSRIEQGQLDRLVLRSAFRVARMEPYKVNQLQQQDREVALQLLATRPHEVVAQETVVRSTSPVWCDESHSRWQTAIRVYLVASGDDYHVMPGGLVRLDQEAAPLDESVLGGSVGKDAWVHTDRSVQHVSLLPAKNDPVTLRRSSADLPSRVADNLFWFGRFLERSQNAARLLRPALKRLTGENEGTGTQELHFLFRCLAAQGQIEPGFVVDGLKARLPQLIHVLPNSVLDLQQPGSLRSSVASAHRNASRVRDRLSLDAWRIVHHLEREFNTASTITNFDLVELDEMIDRTMVYLSALDGLVSESMTRTYVWRFLELGRRLERAIYVVSMVETLLESLADAVSQADSKTLEALLESADSIMTYRGRYLAAAQKAPVLDLLLTDETNPRSLAFQLQAIQNHVLELPHDDSVALSTPEEKIALSLLNGVRMLDVDDLENGSLSQRSKLGQLLYRVTQQLPKLSEMISHRYLIHAGVPQQLAEARRTRTAAERL